MSIKTAQLVRRTTGTHSMKKASCCPLTKIKFGKMTRSDLCQNKRTACRCQRSAAAALRNNYKQQYFLNTFKWQYHYYVGVHDNKF